MAEIRVEPQRRSLAWLWILLLIIVIAAAVWYFVLGAPGLNTTTHTAAPAAGNTTGVTGGTSYVPLRDITHQEV